MGQLVSTILCSSGNNTSCGRIRELSCRSDTSGYVAFTLLENHSMMYDTKNWEKIQLSFVKKMRMYRMKRNDYLDTAKELINGNRAKDYGDAKDNFDRIATGWNVIVQDAFTTHNKITAKHVALMMDWVKTCRLLETIDHKDSWIDKCGYSALGAEFEDEQVIYWIKDSVIAAQMNQGKELTWNIPPEFPDLTQYKQIAIDLETCDPNLTTLEPRMGS